MKLMERETILSPAGLWSLLLEFAGYRAAMPVTELMVFETGQRRDGYYVCPRCRVTLDREFAAFCDRCGQRLDWRGYKKAKIVCPGRWEKES